VPRDHGTQASSDAQAVGAHGRFQGSGTTTEVHQRRALVDEHFYRFGYDEAELLIWVIEL
jgi:hypothetical protein